MNIDDLLLQKSMTKYSLSQASGVPYTTIRDICTGKAKIEKCAADTLYKLAKTLDVTIEDLISDCLEYRMSFEAYKSTVCHQVKDMGDLAFIIDTLKSNRIRHLFDRKWYPESLYLLAMLDYLSRENELPVCAEYNDIRTTRLQETIYPSSILVLCAALKSDAPKTKSLTEAIPEFMRFNIVESEIRDVC